MHCIYNGSYLFMLSVKAIILFYYLMSVLFKRVSQWRCLQVWRDFISILIRHTSAGEEVGSRWILQRCVSRFRRVNLSFTITMFHQCWVIFWTQETSWCESCMKWMGPEEELNPASEKHLYSFQNDACDLKLRWRRI